MSEELTTLQTFTQPVLDLMIYAVGLLDALPGYIRALLTAVLLVWLLARLEREIKGRETRFAELYQKSALFALVAIPTLVLLFPGIRMVVYADVLPSIKSPTDILWLGLLAIWSLGSLLSFSRLWQAHHRKRVEQSSFTPLETDAKLYLRLQHWRRRLGNKTTIGLCYSHTQRPWHSQTANPLIGLPNAAEHWPAPIQDLLLLHELCHYQKSSPRWHLANQLISCVYWPLPWVRGLQAKLDTSLQLSADELAEACYRDPMGYARGLRQIEERLSPSEQRKPKLEAEPAAGLIQRASRSATDVRLGLRRYVENLRALLQPEALPHWDITVLLSERQKREVSERHSDPYDRVLLLVGQAVFLAVVLTGTTLREMPPKVDPNQEFVRQYRLIENFHRSLEEFDAKRNPEVGENTVNISQPAVVPLSSN